MPYPHTTEGIDSTVKMYRDSIATHSRHQTIATVVENVILILGGLTFVCMFSQYDPLLDFNASLRHDGVFMLLIAVATLSSAGVMEGIRSNSKSMVEHCNVAIASYEETRRVYKEKGWLDNPELG